MWKELNSSSNYILAFQEAGSISRVAFALSKSPHFITKGAVCFALNCKFGTEGLVCMLLVVMDLKVLNLLKLCRISELILVTLLRIATHN